MSDIQAIAASVNDLAAPGMKPKALLAAVRERHPEASKKEVVRAAFYAVITQADADPEKARRIQDAALGARAAEDAAAPDLLPAGPKPKRKGPRKK